MGSGTIPSVRKKLILLKHLGPGTFWMVVSAFGDRVSTQDSKNSHRDFLRWVEAASPIAESPDVLSAAWSGME